MDIVTVGAGPCGLLASCMLSEMGHGVTVIEEHPRVGLPVHCAGLVGKKLVAMMGDEHVVNHIDGASIFLNDASFTLRRENVAYVIDRASFDASLCKDLDIVYGSRVAGISQDGQDVVVRTDGGSYRADYVIGADGPNSIVRRSLPFSSDVKLYAAYQERVRHVPGDEHMVTVDVKRPFFSWIIPEGDGVVRVGTIGRPGNISSLKDRFGIDGKVLSSLKAPIPIGKSSLVCGKALLVGDAGAQTKPLTGGGLYYGLRAARMLADALGADDPQAYQSAWDSKFGKEVGIGLKARRVYENMSARDLQRTFDIIAGKKPVLESGADFEKHSTALRMLLSSPGLISVLGKNIGHIF